MVPNTAIIATDPSAVPCDRFILAFLFGPGLVSISPANMMIMSRMLVFSLFFVVRHSGLEPELCILVIKMLCVSCCCSHIFRFIKVVLVAGDIKQ